MNERHPIATHPPTAPKKGNQGCFVALGVLGVVFLVGLLVAGIGLYRLSKDPLAQKMVKAVEESAKVAEEGRKAPGAAEVRAAGCSDAMVFDPAKLSAAMGDLFDAGADGRMADGPKQVVCQMSGVATAPSCDVIAKTYADAVHPAEPFGVSVQKQGGGEGCAFLYGRFGTRAAAQ